MYIIGIDEVGRGPIAGPLVVCACAVQTGTDISKLFPDGKLRDSKKLTEKQRLRIMEQLPSYLETKAIVFGIGEVAAWRVDEIGLSLAIKEALADALARVHIQNIPQGSFIFLDGSLAVDKKYEQETIIKGDEKIPEIALASIVAKTHRDSYMKKISELYPLYGFDSHVGYGTKAHYEAIKKNGITSLHRKSFLKGFIV
jgi:ribonuclease HII